MAKLELFLLGIPQIYLAGQAVTDFNTRKDCALLVYLAVTGTAHSRETLAGLLWSELPEDKARRNLRHALSHLQKVIGPQWLETERGVALTQRLPWSVDVHTLRSAVKNLTTSQPQPQGVALPNHWTYSSRCCRCIAVSFCKASIFTGRRILRNGVWHSVRKRSS